MLTVSQQHTLLSEGNLKINFYSLTVTRSNTLEHYCLLDETSCKLVDRCSICI